MINNRPRGICFNKNALNIQLNAAPDLIQFDDVVKVGPTTNPLKPHQQSPGEPSPPKLRGLTRSTRPLQPLQSVNATNENEDVFKLPLKLTKPIQHDTIAEEKAAAKLVASNAPQLAPAPTVPASSDSTVTSKIPRLSTRFSLLTRPKPLANVKLNQPNAKNLLSTKHLLLPSGHENHARVDTAQSAALDEGPEVDEDSAEEIEDIDKSTAVSRDAIFMVSEIAKDIYSYMYQLEEAQPVAKDFLKDQSIYTPKIRQRLHNWVIEIHEQLHLLAETLYIALAVMDRYFNKVKVRSQSQVQLVAVAAILIASKYEEIYPPEIVDLIHLTQNAYSKRDIMRMEITILEQLNFDLGRPVPLAFLRRFSKAAHCDLKTHSIAKYLMELSLCEYDCSHWQPSLLAASSLFVAIHVVRQASPISSKALTQSSANKPHSQERWTKTLVHYSRYSRKDLIEPAGNLCKIVKNSQKNPQLYQAVKKNASSLTKWPELKSVRVDELIKLSVV